MATSLEKTFSAWDWVVLCVLALLFPFTVTDLLNAQGQEKVVTQVVLVLIVGYGIVKYIGKLIGAYGKTRRGFVVLAIALAPSAFLFGIPTLLIESNPTTETVNTQAKDAGMLQKSPGPSGLTAEEAYSSPFVTNIRIALNSYLSGETLGLDPGVSAPLTTGGLNCGLDAFDKEYYRSKFVVWDSQPYSYGGVATDIVFVDKPDTIFWAWVYQLQGTGEYQLRGFCKSNHLTITPNN